MSSYSIDFQSGGSESSPTIPGKTSITLPQNSINSTATTLTLTGKGVPNYGEIQQENFIRLLENFASKTAPAHPTVGQVWFDTTEDALMVYNIDETWGPVGFGLLVSETTPATATEGLLWYSLTDRVLYLKVDPLTVNPNYPLYVDGTWVQVWPHVTQYASYTEYNALAARINKIIGTASTSGSDSDVANNQWGWGQTDTLPTFTDINTPEIFDNTAWITLLSRLRKAVRHTSTAESTVSTVGFIDDGRGPNADATLYTPAVAWNSGWDGNGIAGLNTYWAALETSIGNLETNRFTVNASGAQIANIHTDQTVGSTWASNRVLDVSIQFTNHTAAKHFFNTGSMVRFTIALTTGAGLASSWYTTINTAALDSSGLCMDFKGNKIGISGTTSFQDIYTLSRSGLTIAYGTGSLVVAAKYDSTTGLLVMRLSFNEDFTSGQSANQLTVVTDVRKPINILSGAPHIDTPVIATPSCTTSGTFLTALAGT